MSSANSPTFPSLHLRHSSFSNLSFALPTSQLILQPFCCFTYVTVHSLTLLSLLLVTGSSLTSPGEPPMMRSRSSQGAISCICCGHFRKTLLEQQFLLNSCSIARSTGKSCNSTYSRDFCLNPYSAKGLEYRLYATLHKIPREDAYSFCLFLKSENSPLYTSGSHFIHSTARSKPSLLNHFPIYYRVL